MSVLDQIRAWHKLREKKGKYYDAEKDPAIEEYFEISPEADIITEFGWEENGDDD
jgi:hypothetical protein